MSVYIQTHISLLFNILSLQKMQKVIPKCMKFAKNILCDFYFLKFKIIHIRYNPPITHYYFKFLITIGKKFQLN